MGLIIDAPQPDKPLSGESIQKESLAGRKTKFVNDSTIASGSFTIAAGASQGVNFSLGLWAEDLPASAQNADNIISWNNTIAWAFEDVYVDTDANNDFLILIGASLSSEQQKVKIHKIETRIVQTYSGSTGYSFTTRYRIYNDGASSHTLYFYGRYKYIVYGDTEL